MYICGGIHQVLVQIPGEVTELLNNDTPEDAFSQGNNRAVLWEPA
jgi:hypothetical protein